jgi:hypothetical protein
MPPREPKLKYAILIAVAILLPFMANPGFDCAWPFGSAACLALVLLYIRSDRRRVMLDHLERCRREQLCVQCGYSLTGNTSGICPECGTSIVKPEAEHA